MKFAARFMSNKLTSWSIFVLLCFIWGSSFILMKVSSAGLTGSQIAALRIFASALVFIPFSFFHARHIRRNDLGLLFLTGMVGNLLPAFCFAIAITRIDSSLEGILNSLTPICVVAIGVLIFRDRISVQRIIGIMIGFAGLCLLTMLKEDIHLNNLGYALLVVSATISYGMNVNLVSHYMKTINPIHIATVSLSFMALPAGLVLWWQGFFQLDFNDIVVQWSIFNTLLLGLVGSSFATILFYVLVQKAGGIFASLVTYGIPFVALFWGFTDGESITLVDIICLPLILFGVYLANRPGKKIAENNAPPGIISSKAGVKQP